MAFLLAAALALAPVLAAEVPGACPRSFEAWSAWRQRLLSGMAIPFDLVTAKDSDLLKVCKSAPGQAEFFSNAEFTKCMAALSETQAWFSAWIAGEGQNLKGLFSDPTALAPSPDYYALPEGTSDSLRALNPILKEGPLDGPRLAPAIKPIIEKLSKGGNEVEAFAFHSETGHLNTVIISLAAQDPPKWIHLDGTDVILLSVQTPGS